MPKENYNPFLLTSKLSATEYMYERLMIVETYSCEEIPWLATGYEWTDPQTLVFDTRDGVKWTDGESFTAEDVAFTFNMLKEYPVLDLAGVGQYIDSVEATSDNQVTFSFNQPGASAFQMINGVAIVPEHIWSKVEDPTTFTNSEDPVGTGPMKVKAFNPRELTIERNPDYWQADDVKVQEIKFHKADAGGQIEQLKLSRGEYDHQGMYIPDIEKSYVSRDPEHNHYWYAPGGVISVYMNLTKAPFDDVEFRRALTTAFNHDEVVEKAQLGYVEQASQTGLVIPGQEEWLPEGLENEGKMPYDPDAADQALTAAGYELDSEGRRLDKNGDPISFSSRSRAIPRLGRGLRHPGREPPGLGFDVAQETPTPAVHDEDRKTGNYDMMFGVYGGTCDMYRNFADPLDSERTAPVGEPALTNETRWSDPETDDLLADLKVATDEDAQKEAVTGLAGIMMDEVPNIPIWYGAKWFQYNTKNAVGWPNEDDPYVGSNDFLPILTHLRPAGDEG